jgi:hypothetical protein
MHSTTPIKPFKQPTFYRNCLWIRFSYVRDISMQYAVAAFIAKVAALFPTRVARSNEERHRGIIRHTKVREDCRSPKSAARLLTAIDAMAMKEHERFY